MKKLAYQSLICIFLAAVLLVGCSSAPETADESKFKVGLLLPGPINDGGWNASAYEGLKQIEAQYDVEVKYQESIPDSSFEEVFREFATQGFDVVFGHGYQFNDAALNVAKDFPETKFMVTSSEIFQEPNVASVQNEYFGMGYLQGIVAAYMTQTKTVAFIGGEEMPPITNPMRSFEAGVKSVDPDIEVYAVMLGTFEDTAKAKEMAYALSEQGVDIICTNANQLAISVIEACKEKGIYHISSISDQAELGPDTVITSGVADITVAMVVATGYVIDGSWAPQHYSMGVAEEAVYLAPFRNFGDKIPTELQDKLDEITEEIRTGEFNAEEATKAYFDAKGI